jgi:PTS system mannose-specific IIB component/fructoselysine and glucoselysine-specific PTS system IIB component
MAIELYRVDDRLIHGQVVVGWAQPLGISFILLVDDNVAESDWERELYRKSVPHDIDVLFAGVSDACAQLAELDRNGRRGMVLTGDVQTMLRLHECNSSFQQVNLGGIHTGPDRTPCLRYVYLSDQDEKDLKALAARGVRITAQDVPTCHPTSLDEVLQRRRSA